MDRRFERPRRRRATRCSSSTRSRTRGSGSRTASTGSRRRSTAATRGAAWSELTPIQNELIESILQYPGHVIATLRTKTAWETEKDERTGKAKPVKVGLAPIQREGVDYEFTIVLELSEGGLAKVGKTRWSAIADKVFAKPGEKFAKELLGWLGSGEAAAHGTLGRRRCREEARVLAGAWRRSCPPKRCAKFIRARPEGDGLGCARVPARAASTAKLAQAARQKEAVAASRSASDPRELGVPAGQPPARPRRAPSRTAGGPAPSAEVGARRQGLLLRPFFFKKINAVPPGRRRVPPHAPAAAPAFARGRSRAGRVLAEVAGVARRREAVAQVRGGPP
jgi:hypothetical protein